MRAVIQVVSSASVRVENKIISEINNGFLILLAISNNDTEDIIVKMADKIKGLRVFPDENGKMNLSLEEVGGQLLVVSQFTLYANTTKGNRPSFTDSAAPVKAVPYYEKFISLMRERGFIVKTGQFGAMMSVSLVNEGPITIIIDI